jgi:hypothetical protein
VAVNRRSRWPAGFVAALVSVFCVVIVASVLRRSEDYSSYPQYSSLNNAESGTKAYFDSLERLGYTLERNYKSIDKVQETNASFFYVGLSSERFRQLPDQDLADLARLATMGVRLVVVLDPKQVEWPNIMQAPTSKQVRKNVKAPVDSLLKIWGVKLERAAASDQRFANELGGRKEEGPAKAYLWYFASWRPEWRTSGSFGNAPLFLERKLGRGAIVLMANADLLTNRQLLSAPDAEALAAAAGNRRRMIFDETHLGVADTGSVAGLAAAHNLQWLLLGFVMLAVFYVWRNSVSFVPPMRAERDAAIAGLNAHGALTALLMRSIPENQILATAAAEWNASWQLEKRPGARPLNDSELFQARGATGDEAIRLYREFSKRLNGNRR